MSVRDELTNQFFIPNKWAAPLLAIQLPEALTSKLANVSWEALYLSTTAVVGALIAYQALTLKRHHGELPENRLFSFASLAETIWSMVSAGVLYWGNFATLPKVIAVAYVLYAVFGWAYSFYLLKDTELDMAKIDDIKMPAKYMDYSLGFSWVIMLSSLAFLVYLWQTAKITIGL